MLYVEPFTVTYPHKTEVVYIVVCYYKCLLYLLKMEVICFMISFPLSDFFKREKETIFPHNKI
jgi:hypothetical protein